MAAGRYARAGSMPSSLSAVGSMLRISSMSFWIRAWPMMPCTNATSSRTCPRTSWRGTMPAAWVRQRPNGRVFYVGFGLNEEFDKPEFLQLIADGTVWTTQKRLADYRR